MRTGNSADRQAAFRLYNIIVEMGFTFQCTGNKGGTKL